LFGSQRKRFALLAIKLKTFYLKENTFKLPDFSVAWLFFIKKRLLFDLANLPPDAGNARFTPQ
jgi:hypothetical protein